MATKRFKLSAGYQKFGLLLAIIIAGALLVSYGFNRIENEQHRQDQLARGQQVSISVLCEAVNRFRPPPPKLNCAQIQNEVTIRVVHHATR